MPTLTPMKRETERTLDLLVVGLGPAGVSCALQARRDGLDLLAVGDEPVGGLVRAARRLDNLPGAAVPGITGRELAERMAEQVEKLGIPVTEGLVVGLVWNRDAGCFAARLSDGRAFSARAVCLATGTRPRAWNLRTEVRWLHRDVRSLPVDLTGAEVAVVGGGEAALDTALSARDRGAAVTVLARARLRSTPGLVAELEQAGIEVLTGAELAQASHSESGWALTCSNGAGLSANELVVCIGREPRDELAAGLCPEGFELSVSQPHCPGLYLAGDAIRGHDRYVATALGDGQRAAIEAREYLFQGAGSLASRAGTRAWKS